MNPMLNNILACEVPNINQHIKDIDWGGCGLFALLLYREIKHIAPQAKIKILGHGSPQSREFISDAINNGDNFDIPMSHIVVEVESMYYDNLGEHSHADYNSDLTGVIETGEVSEDDLQSYVEMDNCWNERFIMSNKNNDVVNHLEGYVKRLFKPLHIEYNGG